MTDPTHDTGSNDREDGMLRKSVSKYSMSAIFATGLALAVAAEAQAQTVLRFADYGPNRGSRAEEQMWFADELAKRTDGRVRIEFHWGGALLSATGMFDGIASGVAAMGAITAAYFPQQLYAYSVGDAMIAVPDSVASSMALYEMGTSDEQMLAEFDRSGLVYIANYTVGPIQFICTGGPIGSLDDLRGKKIRYSGDIGKVLEQLGANAVPLPLPETYQGLDTGLVDCAQTYAYTAVSYKLFEVTNQYLDVNWATLGSNGVLMNKSQFEALGEEDQQVLRELGREFTERLARRIEGDNREVIENFRAGYEGRTIDVVTPGPEEIARLDELGQPFVDEWVARGASVGADGARLLETYRTLTTKYATEAQE
ncbi:dicarboxylate-binding protein [Mesorhizobium microcysteis]|uniref:Dicarboxylate-binding protein n=2 Tax=Neoaquamicrobium microcysteis TaxID=2682781 RepID=A0A5D4GXS6_9HYPH|nr:dicarboxylate-binding protein [Mesorhizobium microcysteis]